MAMLSTVSIARSNSLIAKHSDLGLARLQTEARSSLEIDSQDTEGLCTAFNREEDRVSLAVARCIPTIAALIDSLVPRLRKGGRLIYVGAGNSARVGFMDCSELPVTFSADPEQFITVVAGGTDAIIQAVEGAEDSEEDGATALKNLNLTANDTVVGISASGRTPFVLGALKVALASGDVLTAGITNVQPSDMQRLGVDHCAEVLVGPEFLAGSTRLKAGSAAKQILNMISTCSMVQLGKTYRDLMVDVRVKNRKLQARGRRILRQVCEGSAMYVVDTKGVPSQRAIVVPDNRNGDSQLDMLIDQCGGSIKLACAVAMSGQSPVTAKKQLDMVDGRLDLFIEKTRARTVGGSSIAQGLAADGSQYFLAIDGGGTNCRVSIAMSTGVVVARASSGACNVNSVDVDRIIERVQAATMKASQQIVSESPKMLPFAKVWAGLSGLMHSSNCETVAHRLENLFGLTRHDGGLVLTSDDALLESAIDRHLEGGIAVIAGTGAVATAFRRSSSVVGDRIIQIARTGGWGSLLGDPGSAFDIGRRAVQAVLTEREQRLGERDDKPSALEDEIVGLLDCRRSELMPCLLHSGGDPKHRIALLAHVVTRLASRNDDQALGILRDTAQSLARSIRPLAKAEICEPSRSALVLGGGLMQLALYRELVLESCAEFKKVVIVDDASAFTAEYIARYPS